MARQRSLRESQLCDGVSVTPTSFVVALHLLFHLGQEVMGKRQRGFEKERLTELGSRFYQLTCLNRRHSAEDSCFNAKRFSRSGAGKSISGFLGVSHQ